MSAELKELAGNLRLFPLNEEEVRGSYLPCFPYLSSLQLELVIPDLKTVVPMATPWQPLLATTAIFHHFHEVGQIQIDFWKSFQRQNQTDHLTSA